MERAARDGHMVVIPFKPPWSDVGSFEALGLLADEGSISPPPGILNEIYLQRANAAVAV